MQRYNTLTKIIIQNYITQKYSHVAGRTTDIERYKLHWSKNQRAYTLNIVYKTLSVRMYLYFYTNRHARLYAYIRARTYGVDSRVYPHTSQLSAGHASARVLIHGTDAAAAVTAVT